MFFSRYHFNSSAYYYADLTNWLTPVYTITGVPVFCLVQMFPVLTKEAPRPSSICSIFPCSQHPRFSVKNFPNLLFSSSLILFFWLSSIIGKFPLYVKVGILYHFDCAYLSSYPIYFSVSKNVTLQSPSIKVSQVINSPYTL